MSRKIKVVIADDEAQPALKLIRIEGLGAYVEWPKCAAEYFPAGSGEYKVNQINTFLIHVENSSRIDY